MYIDEIINYLQNIKKVNLNNCLEFVDLYGEYDMKEVIESIDRNKVIKEIDKKNILKKLKDIVVLDEQRRKEKSPTEEDLNQLLEEENQEDISIEEDLNEILEEEQEKTGNIKVDKLNEDIVKQYLNEATKYPLLTKAEEQKYGKDLKLKNDIDIVTKKEIKNKIEPILDLETIFISIENEKDKDYVLTSLNEYLFNYMNKSSNNEYATKYYLLEYEKLCKKLNHIPNSNELSEYFSKNNMYNIFKTFDENKKISSKKLCNQIDKYIKYETAKKKFANSNLRLVIKISKRYNGNNMEILDLISEGNIGLLKAIDGYDIDKGYKFSTYAMWWIRQAMSRAIADKSRAIRIPVHVHENIVLIKNTQKSFLQQYGREATTEELEKILNIPSKKIEMLINSIQLPKSLSAIVGEDGDTTLGDFIEDNRQSVEKEVTNNDLINEVQKIVNSLENEREKAVLKKRFGLENNQRMTLEEVGKEMGVTRERIRQIESKALKKVRKKAKDSGLKDYLQ